MSIKPISKILIANRGEIALRIMRTCRKIGIATVGVYSDADRDAPHTRYADESVYLGPSPSNQSYLNIQKIIEAAHRTGADAIHPGYGFLSEKAEFARTCREAGIVFIGPSPESIEKMGLKNAARKLMQQAGVPVLPGYDGEDQSDETLRDNIFKIGFPVLIKAAAGGGGKGMRVVRSESEIDAAIESARREADKAFGDGTLLLEKFIESARHVEVQILGDQTGNLVHLFERDCSIQRRHQKIIEESPSPAVNEHLRSQIGEAALSAGRAIGYFNAGTVEFILTPEGAFYFIEVNTRLQVEHPVTEMVTGLDLVRLQIDVAEGRALPFTQNDLAPSGHAIEARLYAEDPANDFLPQTGKIIKWRLPEDMESLRIDSGVEHGSEIGIFYDPMLAKLIAWGPDRATALRKLGYALRSTVIEGVRTNKDFLVSLLGHDSFRNGTAHTGFISDHFDELRTPAGSSLLHFSVIAATTCLFHRWHQSDELQAGLPLVYRNNPYRDPSVKFLVEQNEIQVSWKNTGANFYSYSIAQSEYSVELLDSCGDQLRMAIDGIQYLFEVTRSEDHFFVHSFSGSIEILKLSRHPLRHNTAEEGTANSPMPGQVLKIMVQVGQKVTAGDPLILLEAMKMEHTMRAHADGIIEAILVKQGDVVGPGQVLVQIAAL